ncbi:5-formyltetrahydrofolate cyclo-ligase [Rhizorhapis sp.]|uniref:5-formyltetrahydrofolate cyclo-ligase n=1 Tax=Rhizorhapis sp. TaxID=1968842 RepID=UPI002B472B0A|nr:5-formyltetrahydrofolate cyclo-ligase [Rhizorhapis sp.]HKR17325.1 5-formyltetrahydrofolate cyclo-ligase [Rhizorhapis sp.]
MENSSKQDIRRDARLRRSRFVESLPPIALKLAFHAPPTALMRLIGPNSCVALYLPVGSEAPADAFIEPLIMAGKSVCLPCLEDNSPDMLFRQWAPGEELVLGYAGISEPSPAAPIAIPDAIFAPLVAFDRRLNRLGQGGGHYDRVFARFDHAIRIGVAWSGQERDDLVLDPWDMPLHAVVTEREFIEGTTQS